MCNKKLFMFVVMIMLFSLESFSGNEAGTSANHNQETRDASQVLGDYLPELMQVNLSKLKAYSHDVREPNKTLNTLYHFFLGGKPKSVGISPSSIWVETSNTADNHPYIHFPLLEADPRVKELHVETKIGVFRKDDKEAIQSIFRVDDNKDTLIMATLPFDDDSNRLLIIYFVFNIPESQEMISRIAYNTKRSLTKEEHERALRAELLVNTLPAFF